MFVLVAVLFPDVVFMGRTTATSPYASGVLGAPPHADYPHDAVLERDPYLRDPLASGAISEPAARYVGGLLEDPGRALWDPYRSLGQPYLATGAPQLVSPIRWPLAVMPTPAGWDAFVLIRLVLTGTLVHLLAWRMGRSTWAAVGASVFATAGGFTFLHLNSVHVDQLLALALAFHAALSFARRRSTLTLLALAVSGAMVVVADNLQAGAVGMLYLATFLLHLLGREGLSWPRRIGTAAAAGTLSLLLCAVVLVPLVELAGAPFADGLSVHRHADGTGVGLRHLPLRAVGDLLVPYVGSGEQPRLDLNLAIGPGVAFLALLGTRLTGPHRWFLTATTAVMLLKLFGLPVLNDAGSLPVLGSINYVLYIAAPLQLGVALLAGAGIDRVRERGAGIPESFLAAGAVSATAIAAVAWRVADIGPERWGVILLNLGLLVLAVAIIIGQRWRPAPRVTAVALTGVIGLQIGLMGLPKLGAVLPDAPVERALGLPVIDRPVRSDSFAAPPFVEALERRVSQGERVIARGGLLFPNTAGVFGLYDLRGSSAMTVERFHQLTATFVDHRRPWRFLGRHWDAFLDPQAHPRFPEVLDLLGVRWVVSHGPLPDRPEARRHDDLRPSFSGPNAVVYRNPDALPRAFLVHDVVAVGSPAAALAAMADPDLELRSTAVIETSEPPAAIRPTGDTSVRILQLDAARLRIAVDTPTPGVLVVSDTYYPGWQAQIDGATTEVLPAYGALRAVPVPAGTSTVELVFRPTSVVVGGTLSLATLGGLVLTVIIARVRGRRPGIIRVPDEAPPTPPAASPSPQEAGV